MVENKNTMVMFIKHRGQVLANPVPKVLDGRP